MAGQKPITYDSLLLIMAGGHDKALPIPLRPNTFAEWDGDESEAFNIFVHDTRIATILPDGSVMVNLHGWDSNLTVNRVNDVLIPLGSKMIKRGGKLYVQDTRLTEYIPNTNLIRLHNEKGQ